MEPLGQFTRVEFHRIIAGWASHHRGFTMGILWVHFQWIQTVDRQPISSLQACHHGMIAAIIALGLISGE